MFFFCRRIRSIVSSHGEHLWVGLTDRKEEGTWRFVTDDTICKPNEGNHLFPWAEGEPNNIGGEHCARVRFAVNELVDNKCNRKFHGLCEIEH